MGQCLRRLKLAPHCGRRGKFVLHKRGGARGLSTPFVFVCVSAAFIHRQ